MGGSIISSLWTPRYLHREVIDSLAPARGAPRDVRPQPTIAIPPLWVGLTLNQNAAAFGVFGTVIAFFAYILTGTTLSMVCAVLAYVCASAGGDPACPCSSSFPAGYARSIRAGRRIAARSPISPIRMSETSAHP
jgi:hypothetical protein